MTAAVSEQFAKILAGIRFDALDPEVVDLVRQRLLDTAGVAIAGHRMSGAAQFGCPEQGVLADIIRLCAAARASEADDIHIECCVTPGSIVIPVALAIAAAAAADDRATVAAIVAGYEAAVRTGLSIDGAHRVYANVWPSFFVAPIAAAATAAHLLGLDSEAMSHAIGIAATRVSGGSWWAEEPSSRWLVFASAAAEGVRCAYLAASGLRGSPAFLTEGLARTIRLELDSSFLTVARGSPEIMETGMKPFMTSRQSLAAIEAAQQAQRSLGGFRPERIAVRLPSQYRRMIDRPDPSLSMALASVQLQIAIALAEPPSLFRPVRPETLHDPAIRDLMKRVVVTEDSALTDLFPRRWSAVVELDAGWRRASAQVNEPMGSPGRPLGWDGIEHKLAQMHGVGGKVAELREMAGAFARTAGAQGSGSIKALIESCCLAQDSALHDGLAVG